MYVHTCPLDLGNMYFPPLFIVHTSPFDEYLLLCTIYLDAKYIKRYLKLDYLCKKGKMYILCHLVLALATTSNVAFGISCLSLRG